MNNRNKNKGFIALTSVIMISALLMVILVRRSDSSFLTRFNILNSELKEMSGGLAQACIETARLELARDLDYGGGSRVVLGDSECEVLTVGPSGGTWPKIIVARAEVQNIYTKLSAKIDRGFNIITQQELTN
ncbi:MAG: hypothetical protein U9M92_02640 [Patescibacteria group bacterium]|nr:hypothetical protein [Patescibacteria group bacterium]